MPSAAPARPRPARPGVAFPLGWCLPEGGWRRRRGRLAACQSRTPAGQGRTACPGRTRARAAPQRAARGGASLIVSLGRVTANAAEGAAACRW